MRRRTNALLSPAFLRAADTTYSRKQHCTSSRDKTAAGFTSGKDLVVGLVWPKLRDFFFSFLFLPVYFQLLRTMSPTKHGPILVRLTMILLVT